MKRTLSISVFLVPLCTVAMLAACSNDPPPPGEGFQKEFEGAPPWVQKSCSAFEGEKAIVCGVGSMGGTSNISMARRAAIGRARTDLARTLQVKIRAMLKDYSATTGDLTAEASGDEQHVVDVSKQVTKFTLSGTAVQDTWISSRNTFWALVVLDVEKFKDTLSGMQAIDEKVRKAIIERADKAFKELDNE